MLAEYQKIYALLTHPEEANKRLGLQMLMAIGLPPQTEFPAIWEALRESIYQILMLYAGFYDYFKATERVEIDYKYRGYHSPEYLLHTRSDGSRRPHQLPKNLWKQVWIKSLKLRFTGLAVLHSFKQKGIPQPNLENLIHLEQLDLSDNSFQRLPPALAALPKLRTLDMSNNNLGVRSLCEDFSRLTQLEELRLNKTQLRGATRRYWEQMAFPPNLRTLYLEECLLFSVPPKIAQLEQLEVLSLQNNMLGSLPDWLGELPRLRKLILGYPYWVKKFPESLLKRPDLEIELAPYYLKQLQPAASSAPNIGSLPSVSSVAWLWQWFKNLFGK